MKKIIFLVGLLLTLPMLVNAADRDDVQQAESYLRGLDAVKADFIQRADNGSRMSGVFYLNRPGKLRFEYNESDDFIVADGVFIYFYDSELGEQSNAPIGQTLADFLLRKDLSLTNDLTVKNIIHDNNMKVITLAQKEDDDAGLVKLFFTVDPYILRKWQVVDATGATTEIMLKNMQRNVTFPSGSFAYIKPKSDKPSYND